MSFKVASRTRTLVSVDQALHTATYTFGVNAQDSTVGATVTFKAIIIGPESSTNTLATWVSDGSSHTESGNVTLSYADTSNYGWKGQGVSTIDGTQNGLTSFFKSGAVTATASTPTSSSVSYTTATIACNYYPNTVDSTASVYLEYKKTTDSTWTTAGATDTGKSGYTQDSISRNLTGLTAGTQYNFRLQMTRDTANETTLTSATANFTTLTAAPTVTTVATDGIGTTQANFHGTVAMNGATSGTLYFQYDTVTPLPAWELGTSFTYGTVTADGTYDKIGTGLSSNTTYYYRAVLVGYNPLIPDELVTGSTLNFTTLVGSPAGSDETPMRIIKFDRTYGVTTDGSSQEALIFVVDDISTSSSNRFLNTAVPWEAGDVKISKDGGAVSNTANLPTRIGSTPLYTLTLTATEMEANHIHVYLVDADGPAWRDTLLEIRTTLRLGNAFIDADARTDNSAGLYVRGDGSGAGAQFVGGATGNDITGILGNMVLRESTCQAGSGAGTIVLDASASASNDNYNGALILIYTGTGAGQARVITDYAGGTQTCTVNKNWATTPDNTSKFIIFPGDDPWNVKSAAQLSSLPTVTSNYADMLQFVFQRFVLKRTQTATEFKSYKSDGTTALGTGSVTDDGTTQTHGALS